MIGYGLPLPLGRQPIPVIIAKGRRSVPAYVSDGMILKTCVNGEHAAVVTYPRRSTVGRSRVSITWADKVIIDIADKICSRVEAICAIDEIIETNGNIQPQFTGPLAQAQKSAIALRRVNDGLSVVSPILDRWPDAKNKIDEGVLMERVLEELDFYQEAIVDEETYNEIKESINMARQRQSMLENAKIGSEVAKNLGAGQGQGQLTGAA